MTMQCTTGRIPAAAIALGICLAAAGGEQTGSGASKWWQRGQSRWVYMDDWTGKFITGARSVKTTFEVTAPVRAACIRFWSSAGGDLVVNGKLLPHAPDRGPIEDADLKPHLRRGANTIELRNVGEVVAEGGVVLEGSREITFATDASWAEGKSVRVSTVRRGGSRGYMGDYHVARPLAVTTGQKARVLLNNLNLARRRLTDRDRMLFWRVRDPVEILTRGRVTDVQKQWLRIEGLLGEARPIVRKAEQLVLDGRAAEAIRAAAPAKRKTDEAERLGEALMARLVARRKRRRAAVAGGAKGGHRSFNGSRVNRLGWVASCEPLDSDPVFWESDLAPPGVKTLGLAGLWRIRLDPTDQGLKRGYAKPGNDDGWETIFAPTKWGWERWGHTAVVPGAGVNKPYNGLAWYRKRLVVPKGWAGSDVVLRLGDRWGNNDWLAVNGTFLNDPAADRRGSNAGAFTIPARLIRFGKPNTLALRVFNHSNIGGIVNPGVRLSVAGAEPANVRSPVGPASVRERVFQTDGGPVTQVVYSSALSPGVIVTTTGRAVRLHARAARGFASPDRAAYVTRGQLKTVTIALGTRIDPAEPGENWLLLWSTASGATASRPVLIVFEARPAAIGWTAGPADWPGLLLRYGAPGPRVGLVRPLDRSPAGTLTGEQLGRCRLWARAMLRYPVGYAERLAFDGELCKVRMDYEYVELADDWQTEPLHLAPLPMLFSYALEHHWPKAAAGGEITGLGCRARSGYYPQMDCGTYRAAVGARHVRYEFARREPKRIWRGAGTLGEERAIGKRVFDDLHEWGFNSSRPQIPFHARSWGLFDRHTGRGGLPETAAVRLQGEGAEFLDEMIGWHGERGMTCILNWFWDFGRGGWSEARGRQIERFWAAIANRYKDEPPHAVAYSILNEPAGLPWAAYQPLVERVTKAIRAHDRTHTISIESGGGWAQPEDLDMTRPTGDENTVYQYHFYGPHKEEFRRNLLYPRYNVSEDRWRSREGWEERMLSPIRFQIRHQADVFHGEFGISHLQAAGAAEGWLTDVLDIHQKYRMGWNWWHYSGRGTYRTGLVAGRRVNPLLKILRDYARRKPPR